MIDRGTRWHTACLLQSKEDHALLEALTSIWVGIHGPMRKLMMDEEAGLAAAGSAKQYHDQHVINVMPRAKEQQAAHIDRKRSIVERHHPQGSHSM